MYIYKDLAFRVIEKSDLEILRKLHNDPSTWRNLTVIIKRRLLRVDLKQTRDRRKKTGQLPGPGLPSSILILEQKWQSGDSYRRSKTGFEEF